MNNGVPFLELVAILQRLGDNEQDATRDEQAITEAHGAERQKATQRRDVAMAEIEKTRASLQAIRTGAESDLRKVGISERDLLATGAQAAGGSNKISELPGLVRHVVRKAREIDDLLQQERRSREIEAKTKQALAELARQPPPAAAPLPPPPKPPALFTEPRPRVSLARPSSVSPPLVSPPPPQQPITRGRQTLWIALGIAVAILTGVLLYVIFHRLP